MRLLNVKTKQITEFSHDALPPYAILSHTWGSEEISFQEFQGLQQNPNQSSFRPAFKKGLKKIDGCCEQASQEGLDWIWVNTYCIDKRSSSELSEAVNSMFDWYRGSQVCYSYLADVDERENLEDEGSAFRGSRWFTRGWTLQELLAPTDLLFFSKSWSYLGRRNTLCHIIKDITGIPSEFLVQNHLSQASIAQRMSWAASRTTTKKEDAAYCLLGIFNINMPLLYGEGEKAFQRLQEEIIKETDDQSIFAWDSSQTEGQDSTDAKIGALALSPADFAGCENVVQCKAWRPRHTMSFELTKKGLRIEMPLVEQSVPHQDSNVSYPRQILGLLNCRRSDDFSNLIAIPLGRPYFPVSQDQITMDGELLLVNRYRDQPTELRPEILLTRSSFRTIHVRMVNDFTDRSGPRHFWTPTKFMATGTRFYSILIQAPPNLFYELLHVNASLEVLHQGENIVVHERAKPTEPGSSAIRTMYIRYRDTQTGTDPSKRCDFVARVDFSLPLFGVSSFLKTVWCHTRRKPKCLERTITCRAASMPVIETLSPQNPEYLRHPVWGKEIVAAGYKVTVDTKKRSVMGAEMFVATLTCTPACKPSLLTSLCIVDVLLLRSRYSRLRMPPGKHKSPPLTLSEMIQLYVGGIVVFIVLFICLLESRFDTVILLFCTSYGIFCMAVLL